MPKAKEPSNDLVEETLNFIYSGVLIDRKWLKTTLQRFGLALVEASVPGNKYIKGPDTIALSNARSILGIKEK